MLREQKMLGTQIGLEADKLTEQGRYVGDDLVLDLVKAWLSANADSFVFDGVPRTINQARQLDSLLAERQQPLQVAFLFEASLEVIHRRVTNRRVCGACRKSFSVVLHRSGETDSCPDCGIQLAARADDNIEALKTRMLEYKEKSEPLVSFFEQKGMLVRINADRAPQEIFEEVATQLLAA